ncbi:hypothetical protein AVEN_218626-1 [Araneus ventricosus]|uniref:Uncharacterized protein n=1 Tax=Araneus ventricosus TaxID=182803 RepID=A0A4Y2JUG9_ARAVE|nr:hypothetical protein AVEN_218626-1 [Araneus ventricosus]
MLWCGSSAWDTYMGLVHAKLDRPNISQDAMVLEVLEAIAPCMWVCCNVKLKSKISCQMLVVRKPLRRGHRRMGLLSTRSSKTSHDARYGAD